MLTSFVSLLQLNSMLRDRFSLSVNHYFSATQLCVAITAHCRFVPCTLFHIFTKLVALLSFFWALSGDEPLPLVMFISLSPNLIRNLTGQVVGWEWKTCLMDTFIKGPLDLFFRIAGSRLDASLPRDTELEGFVLKNATDCASSNSFGAGIWSTYSRTTNLERGSSWAYAMALAK